MRLGGDRVSSTEDRGMSDIYAKGVLLVAAADLANAERTAALKRRFEQIRAQLTLVAKDLRDPVTGLPTTPESLLEAYRVVLEHFDAIGRKEAMYHYYRIAMLEPGLLFRVTLIQELFIVMFSEPRHAIHGAPCGA